MSGIENIGQHEYIYPYLSLSLCICLYICIYGERGGGERLYVILTLPVLNQTVKYQGWAVNSLIQLVIALKLRDELWLLTVLGCLSRI